MTLTLEAQRLQDQENVWRQLVCKTLAATMTEREKQQAWRLAAKLFLGGIAPKEAFRSAIEFVAIGRQAFDNERNSESRNDPT